MERTALARRVGPVAVFAAVLAALLVLTAVRDGGGGDPRAPRPLKLSAGGRAAGAETRAGGAPQDASAPAMYGGEVVIPDRLLAGQPTQGPAYDVVRGDVSAARLTALAKALGVTGEVRSDAEGWVVGDGDRVLRVYRQPGTHWYVGPDKGAGRPVDGGPAVSDPAAPQTAAAEPGTAAPATAAPATPPTVPPDEPKPTAGPDDPVSSDTDPGCKPVPEGGTVCAEPVPCPVPPPGAEPAPCDAPRPLPEPTKPPQPSDDEARAAAQRVFDAAGLSGAAISLNDAWIGKEVVAAPVVGGLPTVGFETRVTVVADGSVEYASGFLGGTEAAGDYPLLAPRDAVKRGGAYGPVRALGDYACPESEPCPTPEPREATGLRLGLQFMTSYDGTEAAYLAPAWLLRFAGSAWEEPVLALPDEFIDSPDPETPVNDAPGDSGGGTDGGGSTGSDGSVGWTNYPPATGAPEPAVDTPPSGS